MLRLSIIFLLLCSTAFAQPFMKCDCSEGTDYLIINGYQYPCPPSIDVGGLPSGITEIAVIPVGLSAGEPFIFFIDKSWNRNFEFYNMVYDKSLKAFFNSSYDSIKVER